MNNLFFILSSVYLVGFCLGGWCEVLINLVILISVIVARQSPPPTSPPNPSKPLVKTEKDIQSEILTVCRKIIAESQIIDSLFSIVEARGESLNIIHACTIAHRLVGIRNIAVEMNVNFLTLSFRLISDETVQFKTAVTLAKHICKLVGNSSADNRLHEQLLMLANRIVDQQVSLDNTSLLQLIQMLSSDNSIDVCRELVNRILSNGSTLTQSQLLWFFTTDFGRSLFTPPLVDLVEKFEVCGFHSIVQFLRDKYPEVLSMVSERLAVETDSSRTAPYIADLVAAAASTVVKNETLIDVLVERFFELSHASMISLFLTRSSGNCELTCGQVDILKQVVLTTDCEDRKKIFLALRVLAMNGAIIHPSIREKFETTDRDELFEFLAINYGIGQDVGLLTMTSWRTVDFTNLVPERFIQKPTKESELNQTECEIRNLLSIVASRNTAYTNIHKTNRRKIERFVPHNFVDAVNWIMCVGPRHDRVCEVSKEWFSATSFGLDGFVLTSIRALRDRTCLSSGAILEVEERLGERLSIVPESFLPDVLEVVSEPTRVVDEICSRLLAGVEFRVRDIAYLINLFGKRKLKMDKMVEDKLFQAIQAWIVPRVDKFGIKEISAIASALETYTGNFDSDTGSTVESLASIDTPVGLVGH